MDSLLQIGVDFVIEFGNSCRFSFFFILFLYSEHSVDAQLYSKFRTTEYKLYRSGFNFFVVVVVIVIVVF